MARTLLVGAKMSEGNLYLYDDRCVWAHGELKPFRQLSSSRGMHKQAEEQAKLTTDELLAHNKHNWRVERADIANAVFSESKKKSSSIGAVLVLKLVDGTEKALLISRSGDDHRHKDLCQRWLGEALTVE
jgi:hypothetical protein